MEQQSHFHINLQELSEIAEIGVRRATLFLGLGLNAMSREDVTEYKLHKLPRFPGQTTIPIELIPTNVPPEQLAIFKNEFTTWVTGCGLREMLEHYALFLDRIHEFGLLTLKSKGLLSDRKPDKERQVFEHAGIRDKLLLLEKDFGIAPSEADTITQLYLARNCLTHGLGVVGTKQLGPSGKFDLGWSAFDMLTVGEETGKEVAVSDLIGGAPTTEAIQIVSRKVARLRTFNSGDKLQFSQQDLWEICSYFHMIAIPTMVTSFETFLRVHGLIVKEEQNTTSEK